MKVKYIKENPNTVRRNEITIFIIIFDDIYYKSEIGKKFISNNPEKLGMICLLLSNNHLNKIISSQMRYLVEI